MIKCNLCNNDIVVILVIFILFCIFMYSNVNNTYENFQSNDMLKKKEYSDLLDHFVDYYEKLTELNKPYGDLLTHITKNETNAMNKNIKSLIENLHDSGDKIKHLSTELSYNLNKIVMINKKYYDLLEEKVIIIDCATTQTTQTTQTTNTKTSDSINVDLYKKKTGNEKKKYDLKTLEKTIIKVKSLINKIEFDPSYKDKLNTLFTTYLSITKNLYKIDIIDTLSDLESYPCDKNELEKIITLLSKNNTLIGAEKPIIVDLNRIKDITTETNKLKKKFIIYGDKRNYFERTKHKMNLEARLCEKLKKLDKPDKNNLILKRFTDDLLEKKNKYVSQLESKIKNIQTLMTDKELADYETYMYRTNDQAKKQFNAIKQGIDNIKNNNKVKINLT